MQVKLSDTGIADARNKNCIGCKNNSADVMVTLKSSRGMGNEFHDFFLSQEQAINLRDRLIKVINENSEPEKD